LQSTLYQLLTLLRQHSLQKNSKSHVLSATAKIEQQHDMLEAFIHHEQTGVKVVFATYAPDYI